MNAKNIKEQLNKKFDGISHKWVKFGLDEEAFEKVKLELRDALNNNLITKQNLKKLLNHFKRHEFFWVKVKSFSGRTHVICKCEIIDENNTKIDLNLLGMEVLYAELLGGTPKSLKLFKLSKKGQTDVDWEKPDDGIEDDLEPPIEEEMTRLGYELYKMTILEKRGELQSYIDSFT